MKRIFYRIWNRDSFPMNRTISYYYHNKEELWEDEMKLGFYVEFSEDLDFFDEDEEGFINCDGFILVNDEEEP